MGLTVRGTELHTAGSQQGWTGFNCSCKELQNGAKAFHQQSVQDISRVIEMVQTSRQFHPRGEESPDGQSHGDSHQDHLHNTLLPLGGLSIQAKQRGLDGTGTVAKVAMERQMKSFVAAVVKAGITVHQATKYVDDVMMVTNTLEFGARWDQGKISYNPKDILDDLDSGATKQEVTLQVLQAAANAQMPF